jgi:plastocyanin
MSPLPSRFPSPFPARPRGAAPAVPGLLLAVLLLAPAVPAGAAGEIEVRIQDNRFVPERVEVPAGQKVRLRVTNEGTEAEEFESTDLNREKIIRPGASVIIFLPPLEPGEYPFFGEFHPETARGVIVAR